MKGSGEKHETVSCFSPDPPLELLIAELSARQHGVASLRQLRGLGMTQGRVAKRVESGRWRRVHPGVVAVSHAPLTRAVWYLAAVLACGPDAALSHRECAAHRGLRQSNRSRVDVTAPGRRGRGRRGIEVHSAATLRPCDVEKVDGIPCTTVARTLLDLADVVSARQLERACEQADRLQVFDLRAINEQLARANGRRGAATLRAILAEQLRTPTMTRNKLEEFFLRLCREAGLPQPRVNQWIAVEPIGYEADFLWREQRLIVEVDGRDEHTTRRAFEHDRLRDQRLTLAGHRVVRFTWRQVTEQPEATIATVRRLLAQGAAI
jgi:very-short-patch-repair endonuclease